MRGRRPVVARRLGLQRRIRRGPSIWLRRHRSLYWLVALGLGAVTAHTVATTAAKAESARRAWGEARVVFVVRRHLDAGDVITGDDVERSSWPLALIPRGAIGADESPQGRTVVSPIESGEAVLASRLAPDGLRGVAALVPTGWRALAVPIGPAVVPLTVGDRVDLVAAVDGLSTTDVSGEASARPFVLAANVVVVATDERAVTVAVPADDAPRVALGIVTNSVVPALRSS